MLIPPDETADPLPVASSPRRLLLAAAGVVGVLVAALVALQLSVGGVPLLDTVVAVAGDGFVVDDTGAPPLDCGRAEPEGGLVPRARGVVGRNDLAVAAEEQRAASPDGAVLVRASGHRTSGGGVTVVWVDAQGRARMILSYVSVDGGYILAARSECKTA